MMIDSNRRASAPASSSSRRTSNRASSRAAPNKSAKPGVARTTRSVASFTRPRRFRLPNLESNKPDGSTNPPPPYADLAVTREHKCRTIEFTAVSSIGVRPAGRKHEYAPAASRGRKSRRWTQSSGASRSDRYTSALFASRGATQPSRSEETMSSVLEPVQRHSIARRAATQPAAQHTGHQHSQRAQQRTPQRRTSTAQVLADHRRPAVRPNSPAGVA